LDRLWSSILRILAYISPGVWLVWPGAPRWGYKRARQEIDAYLYQIIRARRAQKNGSPDDLLGLLVNTPGMSDDLIRDQLLTMLIAGHDTSTALLAWTLYLLGRHPNAMAQARAEIAQHIGPNAPTYKQVGRLDYLDRVVKESLRLYPPIHAGMRRAAVDVSFQGYHIPANTRVMYSIYLTHRHPNYWPEPARFDPNRFSPEQHRARPPLTYVPFGGGPRNCIGAAFGLVEAKLVLARILQRFELTLVQPEVHPHMGATLEPRPGVIMRVVSRR
jgi:cytochrome P450